MNRVVQDLAVHPYVQWAIVWEDKLLPIRFSDQFEAESHLYNLENPDAGIVVVHRKTEAA